MNSTLAAPSGRGPGVRRYARAAGRVRRLAGHRQHVDAEMPEPLSPLGPGEDDRGAAAREHQVPARVRVPGVHGHVRRPALRMPRTATNTSADRSRWSPTGPPRRRRAPAARRPVRRSARPTRRT
ncbi:hypothetical protein NKH77_55045 [Streptomyces sp. M19]